VSTFDKGRFEVKVLSYHELNDIIIQQWSKLEQRAAESNAYLSPYFVLPALKYLTPQAKPIFIIIERVSGSTHTLSGFGIFEYTLGTKIFPLPHLKVYRSPHSYLAGLLIDVELLEPTLTAFFSYFCRPEISCYGIEFTNMADDTDLTAQLEITASRFKAPWIQYAQKKRAILIPKNAGTVYIERLYSAKRRKALKRSQRLLKEFGEIKWRAITGNQITSTCINNFLRLENMGWKRRKNTSLLSQPSHETFFREMIEGFAQNGRAFFTELFVNNEVIASTSNIISSNVGYAFKVGWNERFAPTSPGILNEIELIRKAPELLPYLEYIDSGAEEGSFIDKLWTDSRVLVSGYYVTNILARPVLSGINYARHIKNHIKRMIIR
jgi:hypothetical protein